MLFPAMPAVVLFKEKHILAATARTRDALRPSPRYKVLAAVDRIGEVEDCFLQCGRFHALSVPLRGYFVKYIITLFRHYRIQRKVCAG